MKRIAVLMVIILLAAGCGSKPVSESPPKQDSVPDTVTNPRKTSEQKTATNPEFTITGELTVDDIVYYRLPPEPAITRQKGFAQIEYSYAFWIDTLGHVDPEVIIKKSSGYPRWDEYYRDAFVTWKFKPSEKVSRTAEITFVYTLE